MAFDYAHKSLEWEDSITTKTQTEAIGKIIALYNYQHTEKKNQQLLIESENSEETEWKGLIRIIFETIGYIPIVSL